MSTPETCVECGEPVEPNPGYELAKRDNAPYADTLAPYWHVLSDEMGSSQDDYHEARTQ